MRLLKLFVSANLLFAILTGTAIGATTESLELDPKSEGFLFIESHI